MISSILGGFLFGNFLISPSFRGISSWLARKGGLKRVGQRLNRWIGFLQFLGGILSENSLISPIFRGISSWDGWHGKEV